MSQSISLVEINYEDDVVTARQRARLVARLLSFDEQDQTRISTALSEIARFFVHSNKGGRIDFQLEGATAPQVLLITISSTRGAGAKVRAGAAGNGGPLGPEWESALIAARRLMDQCEVRSDVPEERVIRLAKILPPRAPFVTGKTLEKVIKQLGKHEPAESHRRDPTAKPGIAQSLGGVARAATGADPPQRRAGRHQSWRGRTLCRAG